MNQPIKSSAIAPYRATLERALPAIRAVLPKSMSTYLTPDRMIRVVLVAMGRTPDLLLCTQDSILRSVMAAAELGLEPTGGALGNAYLVPYNKKLKNPDRWVKEAQLIVGYRGYISLARRSGNIQSVESHIVREHDEFVLRFGTDSQLTHSPLIRGDRGASIGAYALARFNDGGYHVEFMTIAEIDTIRKRSKSADNGPWVTDYDEMCRKTVIRRAAKYWPISIEMAKAMDIEDRTDSETSFDFDVDMPSDESHELPAESAVDKLKEKLEKEVANV